MPLLRILVLVFAIANAAGLTDAVLGSACGDECVELGQESDQGSDCDGTCPPICPTCHCAVRSPVAMTPPPACVEPPREARGVAFAEHDRDPASPDPREILHVPRHGLRTA